MGEAAQFSSWKEAQAYNFSQGCFTTIEQEDINVAYTNAITFFFVSVLKTVTFMVYTSSLENFTGNLFHGKAEFPHNQRLQPVQPCDTLLVIHWVFQLTCAKP